MTAGDLAAVLVAVVCLAGVAVLVLSVQSLRRSARALHETVELLREQTVPMVVDLREAVAHANLELERVDGLLDAAERITTTVDKASRLTFRAVSPSLIRGLSWRAGASRASRRLRGHHDRPVIDVNPPPSHPQRESLAREAS